MKHILFGSIASIVILAALIVAFMVRSDRSGTETVTTQARPTITAPRTSTSTLYCEFNNFADQTPLVGFYFRIEGVQSAPVVSLLFQREQDGSQIDFGGANVPSPHWAFDGSSSPATIRAPEGDMQINLYGYDPRKPGTVWFEAGLRSIRYKNLGGRCRQGAGA
ncbi:hypothetical protein [Methylobacterium sp. A54F]